MSSKSLANQTPAQSYKDLLHLGNNGNGLSSNLSPIYDGDGNQLPISISKSQTDINFNGGMLESPIIGGFFEKVKKIAFSRSINVIDITNPDGLLIVPSMIDYDELVGNNDPYDPYDPLAQHRWIANDDGSVRLEFSFSYNVNFLSNIDTQNEFLYFSNNILIMNDCGASARAYFIDSNQINVTTSNTDYLISGYPAGAGIHVYKLHAYIGGGLNSVLVEYSGMVYTLPPGSSV